MTSYSYTQQFLISEKIAQPSSSVGQEMLNLCTSFLSSVSPIAVLSKHRYGDSPRLRGWLQVHLEH